MTADSLEPHQLESGDAVAAVLATQGPGGPKEYAVDSKAHVNSTICCSDTAAAAAPVTASTDAKAAAGGECSPAVVVSGCSSLVAEPAYSRLYELD
jgi:hypothetical protein